MCYNNCIYERFNPVTGDCTCHCGSNPCPEELEYCENCGTALPEDYEESLCPDCFADENPDI